MTAISDQGGHAVRTGAETQSAGAGAEGPAPDASLDTRLRAVLDGRYATVRDDMRKLLVDPRFQPVHGLDTATYRDRVYEQLLAVAGTDLPRYLFPETHGGLDDVGAAVTGLGVLGTGDLSLMVKAGVHWGLFGGALRALGTERHHDAHLRHVMTLEVPGCFAMTETGHGSDVQSLRTTATYDPERGEFELHTPDDDARKDYIGNAAQHAQMAVVFAQLRTRGEDHGVHAFLVPIRSAEGEVAPGVTATDCGHKGGLNGVDNGRLSFDHVRIPREALLDRYGSVASDGTYSSPIESSSARFFTMVGTLVKGRVSVSGAAIGATQTAMTIAVRYALDRRQFTAPGDDHEVLLMDYLQHQRRLLPRLATTYALHVAQSALVDRLAEQATAADRDPAEQRRLESLAAGMKAATTWHATDTIQACREACGGAGYLSENRLTQLKADTDIFTTFEGDNTVLLQLVAKGLLTNYRDEVGDLNVLGMVRMVADQVVDTVVERMAARSLIQSLIDRTPVRDEDADLLDRGYQIKLLEWREQHVLEGVARRMRAAAGGDATTFEVMNAVQDHLLLAAEAHIDRVVLESFVEAIDLVDDPEVADLLGTVCDLHAVANLERNRAWYLEHDRFTPARAKATTAAVNDLCRALRPHARTLVDAFAVPDETVAAPIALGAERRRHEQRLFARAEAGDAA